MSALPESGQTVWQIEDVRGVWTVATMGGRPARSACGFCGRGFESAGWVRLSVARPGLGGTIVDMCAECTTALWEDIAAHLASVTEQLRLADALRDRVGL
jgi:hypothetical protein